MNFITIGWYVYNTPFLEKIFQSCSVPTRKECPWIPVDISECHDILANTHFIEVIDIEKSDIKKFETIFYIEESESMYVGYQIYENCNVDHMHLLTSQESIGKLKEKYKEYIEIGYLSGEPSIFACYESEY